MCILIIAETWPAIFYKRGWQMAKSLQDIKDKTENIDRQKEKGIVNEKTGSSISIKEDGNINIAADRYAQYKLNSEGISSELSLESQTTTNRKSTVTDEVLLNKHKLNPDLYQLADNRAVQNTAMRNLTVETSVLVKTFDKRRNRYVFVRRPARMPMFFPRTDVPDVPEEMSIE